MNDLSPSVNDVITKGRMQGLCSGSCLLKICYEEIFSSRDTVGQVCVQRWGGGIEALGLTKGAWNTDARLCLLRAVLKQKY